MRRGAVMSRAGLLAAIMPIASRHELDGLLVCAQVLVESNGNPWAWNPEPRYRYFWNVRTQRPFRPVTETEILGEVPPSDFPRLGGDRDQEWWGQQASWGLLQVMGAVAREYGFREPYLTELCHVDRNLDIGCAHFARLLRWAEGDTTRALAAYNGGKLGNLRPPFRNQAYADKVEHAFQELKKGNA